MYSNEALPKRLQLAVFLLIALLLVSLQQQVFQSLYPDVPQDSLKSEKQLTLKPGGDSVYQLGIVHDDPLQVISTPFGFAFILTVFAFVSAGLFLAYVPFILSRNACCIIPKGP